MQSHCCWLIFHFACPSRNHLHHFSVKCTHTHKQRKSNKTKKGHLCYKANTYRKSRWFARLSFNKVSTRGLESSLLEICKILLLPHLCSRQLTSHRWFLGGSVLNFHPSVTQAWTPWKINLSLDICPQRQIVFSMKLTELSEHHVNKCSPLWGQLTPLKKYINNTKPAPYISCMCFHIWYCSACLSSK